MLLSFNSQNTVLCCAEPPLNLRGAFEAWSSDVGHSYLIGIDGRSTAQPPAILKGEQHKQQRSRINPNTILVVSLVQRWIS